MKELTRELLAERFPFLRGNEMLSQTILEQGITQTFQPGTMIYWEGDACSHIAFIISGEIRVFKAGPSGREITLYEIIPGDTCILNVSCLLSRTKYPANAVTLSEVKALLLPARVFQDQLFAHQEMQSFVFMLLNDRLSSVMTLLEEVVFSRMDERLTEYLIEKSENNMLATTHQAIANDLGTSREVISRLLKDLELKGRVKLARNAIELLNL